MSDITKKMIKQLRDSYYTNTVVIKEEADNNTNEITLQTNNTIVKDYINNILEYNNIGSTHIKFNDLKYNKTSKKVFWSGTIAGITWSVIYDDNDEQSNGLFFSADNIKLTKDETLSLHKLNLYFQTVWFKSIREAILKNELTQ